jgi:hypothetical protein
MKRHLTFLVPLGVIFGSAAGVLVVLQAAPEGAEGGSSFQRKQLDARYFSEGASFGDLNRDGKLDAVSGPHWWAGPGFEKAQEYTAPKWVDPDKPGYVQEHFFSFVRDLNGDGWADILTIGLPGEPSYWFANPGQAASREGAGHWERHHALDGLGNESPVLTDALGGDGKPELWGIVDGRYGFAVPDSADAAKSWTFHPVIPQGDFHKYTHGMGLGDLNGDGRHDLLGKDGWYEQPASDPATTPWKQHSFNFRPKRLEPMFGGAQMHATDVDGDGDADIVTSIHAHGYGLAWFEQAKAPEGDTVFVQHEILPEKGDATGLGGVQFSQLHALAMTDLDGDGLPDLVTGKCRYAHGPDADPDPKGTPVLYAFYLRKGADGVRFEPRLIDDASGLGRQVSTGDADGDGRPDVLVGNKLGTYLFLSGTASR